MSDSTPSLAYLTVRMTAVNQRLLRTYGHPDWGTPLPPLDELVSTILSQNTNDTNRDRAYQSLRKCFSTWESVRDGDPDDVINAIRSAGLADQKGPRIQALLRSITAERGNLDIDFLKDLPDDEVHSWLLKFNGVGPKTAAIVMLFSLDIPAFPVDTHIYRVTGRLGLRPAKMSVEQTHQHLAGLMQPNEYPSAHLNIIRLGREICHARNPKCSICPVQDLCDYCTCNISKP